MAYKELYNVVFCDNKKCRKVYEHHGEKFSKEDILPCGHRVSTLFLDAGGCIRDRNDAMLMLDWLYRNDAIKPQVFDLVEDHGGKFDDGLNFIVPKSDLTWEEKTYDLDAE